MPTPIDENDLLVAKAIRRKCEKIIDASFAAFRKTADEWGTLSADELIAIGTTLFIKVTLEPLQKMTNNPAKMRYVLTKQLNEIIRTTHQAVD
jgi:hypothetical protein